MGNRRDIGHPTWLGYGPVAGEQVPGDPDSRVTDIGEQPKEPAPVAAAPAAPPEAARSAFASSAPAALATDEVPENEETGDVEVPQRTRSITPAPDDPPAANKKPRKPRAPMVEISVVHEHGPAPHQMMGPWPSVEIWTRNRVYLLDNQMNCVEVRDRSSQRAVANHPFLGAILVGGQHNDGESIELSHPFPRPGTEAVFERRKNRRSHFSRTSTVARVVLRLHIVTVSPAHVVPAWEEISAVNDE